MSDSPVSKIRVFLYILKKENIFHRSSDCYYEQIKDPWDVISPSLLTFSYPK